MTRRECVARAGAHPGLRAEAARTRCGLRQAFYRLLCDVAS